MTIRRWSTIATAPLCAIVLRGAQPPPATLAEATALLKQAVAEKRIAGTVSAVA